MDLDYLIGYLSTLEPNYMDHEFCWTGIHEEKRPVLAYGTLEELLPRLKDRNDEGYGIFVTVNAIDIPAYGPEGRATRRDSDVTRVRAVFADWDDPNKPMPALPLRPTMVVETSERKYHFYWAVDDLPLEEFEGVQRGISQLLGSDTSVVNLSRIMRVPGLMHTKDLINPTPVVLDDCSGIRYTAAQIKEVFPYDPVKHRPKFATWDGQKVERKTAQTAAVVAAQYMPRLDGGFDVRCPWEAEHTTKSSATSTTYWPPTERNDGRGAFVCMHAHCFGKRMVDEFDDWISRNIATFLA